MSKKLLIIGAGDNGQIMANFFLQSNDYELVGFLDDTKVIGEAVSTKPVLGGLQKLDELHRENVFDEVIVAIGYKHLDFKKNLFTELKEKEIKIAKYIHESVILDKSVQIGQGSFILPGVVIDHGSKIGEGVFINPGVTIAHDTKVGDFCFFGPSVNLAGFIDLSERSFLGINTTIIDNILVSVPIQTGASTTIVDNISRSGLYLGTPAKLKKPIAK